MRRSGAILILIATGCSTLVPQPDAYVRDGQQYGVVDGTFRGRWWNHYERGRSFLDGGFYDEAAADLNIALGLRAEDQRWARTYGLHFIPEYFPNRELGITLYHQGALEEAERRLQASIAQESSALAEHYLDLTRAARISAAGGDSTPPVITATVADAATGRLTVSVRDNTYVAAVSIAGEPQLLASAAPEASFNPMVSLRAGHNEIVIAAKDLLGNESELSVAIEHDTDGPALSFDTDTAATGLVSGVAYDPAGITSITIGGEPARMTQQSDGTQRFEARAAGGAIAFAAVDALGNRTEGTLAGATQVRTAAAFAVAAAVDNTWLAERLASARFAQSEVPESGVDLTNLADGQRYLMDEIVVSIEASDPDGIAGISLDGAPLDGLVPHAAHLHVSRRIRLDGMGEHRITAVLTDDRGQTSETTVVVEREATSIELPESRLRVAMLGNLWEGAGPQLEAEADFTAAELPRALFERQRFDLVSRDALPRVLEEQELRTVLGSRDLDAGLRQLVPADVFAVGKVRRTGETLEIILQAVSTETSSVLAYADVAGTVETLDDLRALARDLALRFEQEFPRVSGDVVQVPSEGACYTTLTRADRVRAGLPCVVYRLGDPIVHPATGAVLGQPTEVIARGTLDEVRDQMSRLGLTGGGEPVQVSDHVATR
ncbi:MAG: hypothetical protein GC168_18975 [Candidatus Hydrogenedens sp.]|nr:hypothetical protein [Candidatus Hydrogenedens sp.]